MAPSFKAAFRSAKPYLLLILTATIAYLPVSTFTLALKNDVLSLEYPINYFISQCLHNGVSPLWFNTWAMGFPLESILTWSIFSPVQFIFNYAFHYSLYTLNLEFVFFICLSGCMMLYFLKKHVTANQNLALLLSGCYMLSGFQAGSSQWLLYITAAAFLPILLSTFLSLLKAPGWRSSLLFAAVFYIHLTSVYVAFTIIACYLLAAIAIVYLASCFSRHHNFTSLKKKFFFLVSTAVFIGIISAPALLSSLQLLPYLNRGQPIETGTIFYQSNFLHPEGLQSLLLPLSVTKMILFNTEGTMMNSYMGLLPLLLLPICLLESFRTKRKISLLVFVTAVFFLLVSFGHFTPLRDGLNLLPGFSYFRNPGLFRLYFIFFLLIFIAVALARLNTANWYTLLPKKVILVTAIVTGLLLLTFAALHFNSLLSLPQNGFKALFRALSYSHTVTINAIVQLLFMSLIVYAGYKKKPALFTFFVLGELVMNTLLCTPFFTVSSYTIEEVNQYYDAKPGFPLQLSSPSTVPTTYREGAAVWPNTNVYRKEVSLQPSYWGPLVLINFSPLDTLKKITEKKGLLSATNKSVDIKIEKQLPNHIVADIRVTDTTTLHLLQNYYPGWKAYLDGNEIELYRHTQQGMTVNITSSGKLEFIYQKKALFITVIVVNLLVLAFLGWIFWSRFFSLRH